MTRADFDDGGAHSLAVRAGLAGGAYAPLEQSLAAGLLAAHGLPPDAETTVALLPADTADGKGRRWDLVAGATGAAQFLATGPALVIFDRSEVSCHSRRSIAREDFHRVEAADATGRVLCERPGCPSCDLATARARCRTAGYLWGIARASIDAAVLRTKHRRQFGRAIGDNQAIAFRIAALTARAEALGRLGEAVASRFAGADEPLRHTSELLAACADLAMEASAESLHLHGVEGLLASATAQDLYRTAHTFAVRHGSPSRLRLEPQPYGRSQAR
ncbi:acyl-CoA dehydrogenase family protein [Nonomuraea sp. NPDC050404]|uniref:acyl-CoA dehydrogenase family protein n=1 Tax=Nonomuraea sp. NPDC050404 TaxID=3155783 RepID=UPI0033F27FAA